MQSEGLQGGQPEEGLAGQHQQGFARQKNRARISCSNLEDISELGVAEGHMR